jgi:hypothetical protein
MYFPESISMRGCIWDTEIRQSCTRIDYILRDMNTEDKNSVYDVFHGVFSRAYATSSDWPAPYTRVDTYAQHMDQAIPHLPLSHSGMREYTRSRGFRGVLSTQSNSPHLVRTILRMTGLEFRKKLTRILSECIKSYGDKLPLVVLQCPETWLFVESAHGIMQQCADGMYPSSGALVHLASILPSKADWCKLSEAMKFKIDSVEANTHLWCWFRLQHVFGDFISYSNVWTSGCMRVDNPVPRRVSTP